MLNLPELSGSSGTVSCAKYFRVFILVFSKAVRRNLLGGGGGGGTSPPGFQHE